MKRDDEMISYAELINRIGKIELPNNYLNTKFSDILQGQEDKEDVVEEQIKTFYHKTETFEVERAEYEEYFMNHPQGSLSMFKHRDKQIKLFGFGNTGITLESIWKTLLLSKPDVILLPVRPDRFLNDFQLNYENPKTKAFSNRLYYSQLELNPRDIEINKEVEERVTSLIDKKFLSTAIAEGGKTTEGLTKEYYTCTDKLTEDVLALVILFAKRKGIPIVLADMPEIIYKQKFCNTFTIAQLRQIFEGSVKEMAINPDITPQTPLNMNLRSMPEFSLQSSDSYTTSLIEYMIKKKPYKRYMVFGGVGQSYSIKELLMNRLPITLYETMDVPEFKPNIYGKYSAEELIEKLSLFDVFNYGELLMKQEDMDFKSTFGIIELYTSCDEDHPKTQYYRQMYFDFIQYYFEQYVKEYSKGIKNKEDFFIEQRINN